MSDLTFDQDGHGLFHLRSDDDTDLGGLPYFSLFHIQFSILIARPFKAEATSLCFSRCHCEAL
jgi:hypothetical protein